MKKTISAVLVCALVIVMALSLVSCGSKISQAYADEVNKAADNNEPYTLAKVKDDLGENAIDITFFNTGVVIAVEGVTTQEELERKIENKEVLKGLTITIVSAEAISATYGEIDSSKW